MVVHSKPCSDELLELEQDILLGQLICYVVNVSINDLSLRAFHNFSGAFISCNAKWPSRLIYTQFNDIKLWNILILEMTQEVYFPNFTIRKNFFIHRVLYQYHIEIDLWSFVLIPWHFQFLTFYRWWYLLWAKKKLVKNIAPPE